jgi:hypothetical protein
MPMMRSNGFTSTGGTPIFEYTGATALTVVGSGTGRTYHFERLGARVAIDARDQQSVARVPNVRRVAGGT